MDSSLSQLTTKAYKKSVTMFHQFCQSELHIAQWFPAQSPAVVSFITFCFQKGYAPSSITSTISAISYVHKMHNLVDPTATFVVRKILQGAAKLRPSGDQRAPVTKSVLYQLVSSTPHVSHCYYNRVLTSAMYLLAFHAFLRIGEMVVSSTARPCSVLQMSQLAVTANEVTVVFLRLCFMHTNIIRVLLCHWLFQLMQVHLFVQLRL